MKHLSVFVSLVLGPCLMMGLPAAAQQITLLHVNDTHSHLTAWGPKDFSLDGTLGGLPKAAAIVAAEKASNPQAVFVHSGDFMSGDLFFPEYLGVKELQLLRSIGLDALVLGNHEFQLGPDFLKGVLDTAWSSGAAVPVLGTNLDLMGHPLGTRITSTLLKDVDGVKVGFFGCTTPSGAPMKPNPVKVLPCLKVAPGAVTDLRAAGAQVVIAVTHFGMDSARQLAQTVPGIDVIVNGHDNAALVQPEVAGTTLIVSAGNHYRWVGRLRLSVDGDRVSFFDYALVGADAATLPLPAVQEAVDSLKPAIVERYGDVYHQVLAWADQDVTNDFNPRHAKRATALGDLFTDAYRARTRTDIALEASGYLGDTLPAGAIVGADIFRAMSYGPVLVEKIVRPWRLATFRANGADLIRALATLLAVGGNSFPQVSGLRMDYDSSSHEILLDTVHVGGHKLLAEKLYSVTVTEGVLSAVKGLVPSMQEVIVLPDSAFDAAREYVTLRGNLSPAASNRIRDIAAIPGQAR